MNFKGLSQVLYLIIAAAVLMMVGLSLVFAFTGSGDTSTVDAQACIQSMQLQCSSAPSSATIDLPATCTTTDNSGTQELVQGVDAGAAGNVKSVDDSSFEFTCN